MALSGFGPSYDRGRTHCFARGLTLSNAESQSRPKPYFRRVLADLSRARRTTLHSLENALDLGAVACELDAES